jgi:CheY-like chemotaxis protein
VTRRILYIDDEADIREVAAMALELNPEFEVRTGGSGAEALTMARNWRPDLIMLDVMMPGMDGPTTLASLREDSLTRDIPVIFITARTQAREVQGFRALGAIGVLAKPFDPMDLAAEVRGIAWP